MIPDLTKYHERLVPAYVDYCETVSARSMALSDRTSALLLWLASREGCSTACDLGSGFSSYVLRLGGVRTTSVDHDDEWLSKTKAFLRKHRLPTRGLATYDQWSRTDTYDLILVDFADGERREAAAWEAVDRLNPGGVIVFDDAQNASHRDVYREIIWDRRLLELPVYDATIDGINRYAMAAAR